MKTKYLLDSVILIEHLNNLPQATKWLIENLNHSQISIITRMEVLSGYSSTQSTPIKKFLNRFLTASLTLEAANLVAAMRHEHRWKLPDAIQAGLSQHYSLKLVTRNTKDFPPEKFPFVVVPY